MVNLLIDLLTVTYNIVARIKLRQFYIQHRSSVCPILIIPNPHSNFSHAKQSVTSCTYHGHLSKKKEKKNFITIHFRNCLLHFETTTKTIYSHSFPFLSTNPPPLIPTPPTIATTTNNTSSATTTMQLGLSPFPTFPLIAYRSICVAARETARIAVIKPSQSETNTTNIAHSDAVQCTKRGSCQYRRAELLFTVYHQVSRARMHATFFSIRPGFVGTSLPFTVCLWFLKERLCLLILCVVGSFLINSSAV